MNTNGNKFTNGVSGSKNFTANPNNNNSNELIDFKRFYSITKRYLWVIILCAVLGVGAAYYLAFEYMLPVYQSTSTVLIESNAESYPGGSSEIGRIVSSSYNLTSNQTIESEIQFLKSRELGNEVGQQLLNSKTLPDGSLYPILWAEYPEDSTLVSLETASRRIRTGLTVEPMEKGSSILSISFESYSPHEASRIVNSALNSYQNITAEKKRTSAKSALEFLNNKKAELQSELDQAENRLSGFKNNRNVVAIESQTSSLVTSSTALETQKQEIAIQLEALNSGIKNYESQLDAIKPGLGDRYSQAIGPTIKRYQEELGELKAQRLLLISNNPQLKDNPNSEPQLRELNRKIGDLQTEVKSLADQMVSEENGSLGFAAGGDGSLAQEILNIQNQLTRLRLEKNQKQAQLEAINSRLGNNEASLAEVPENQKRLGRLERQVNIYEQLFLTVNEQASEISIWEQTRRGAGTIIDYAVVSNSPIKPQKPLWLLGGFLLGIFLPLGFILLKEAFNEKINSIEAFKNKDYPLLAVIYDHSIMDEKKAKRVSESSRVKNNKISDDLILYHYGLSPIAESYRSFVSQILYSHPDNPPKTLLMTSPSAGEGKTTLTANMAVALTEVGKKVLIVDCDMRKPGIPKFFGISKHPGIMEVLFKDYPVGEAVKDVPIPGLNILTAGKKQPARPNSVIGSQSFKRLIEQFKLEYDFILLDSAPFGIIGDVAPILQLTDGVIVNSKFLSTKNIQLNHTLDQLEKNSAQVLGLVLNNYNPKKSLDDSEIKGLYNNLYSGYYDYHEPKKSKRKYFHGKNI